ncbi:MAG TPA: D-aminoacyl-tRNA deacylase [Gaiellaceae bacterium]|jgi:D-aminoacyl-tRNA deacylase
MRAVVQRVARAHVLEDGRLLGEVAGGFCVLLGIARGDDEKVAENLAKKLARLRIFPDDEGRFSHTLKDVGGSALVVSQFTLLGDTKKGNRPSFSDAAPGDVAEPLYERFCDTLRAEGVGVATGRFGALMQVELVNDGPVTIILDS